MKNMFKLFILSFATVPLLAFAADTVLNTNKVKVGQKTSASDKVIEFDTNSGAANPKLKVSPATNKIQFTNDGANFKDIGSGGGGGGGVNFLQDLNGDFETGSANWTNSGGTFTTSTVSPIEGDRSGVFTASGTGQFIESALIVKKLGAGGRSCMATFDYNWVGVAGQLQARVLDSTNAVIAGPIDLTVTTSTQVLAAQLPLFDCDAATQFKIRVTSTAASAALKLDSAFIGYGRNNLQVSQAELVAAAQTSPTTTAAQTTSGTMVDMVYNSAKINVLQGRATAAAGDSVAITIPNLAAGKYEVTVNMSLQITGQTTTTTCLALISDGTGGGGTQTVAYGIRESADTNQNGKDNNVAFGVFEYATPQSSRTFRIQAQRTSGNGICNVATVQWAVKYYPLNANNAVTVETSGWNVAGTIYGDELTYSLGAAAVTAYSNISTSSGLLSLAPSSQPAQIICSGTNAPTGTTCAAGNEQIGVAFDIPDAGLYEACFDFSYFNNNGPNTAAFPNFRLYSTNPADDADISNPLGAGLIVGTAAGTVGFTYGSNVNLCRDVAYGSAGKKALRVKYTQATTGTPTTSVVQTCAIGGCTGGTSFGIRGVDFRIRKKNQQTPTPIYSDLQNSFRNRIANSDSGQSVFYSARINNNGTVCAVDGSIQFGGAWISSASRAGAGNCIVNFASGFFNGTTAPVCVALSDSTVNNNNEIRMNGVTATNVNIITATAGGATADQSFNLMCMGRR